MMSLCHCMKRMKCCFLEGGSFAIMAKILRRNEEKFAMLSPAICLWVISARLSRTILYK